MVTSILDDIKSTFRSGNTISRIILVNVAIYIILNLIYVFDAGVASSGSGFYDTVKNLLSLPSDPSRLLRQPWSIFTHMILHVGFWHILWNMLLLYWFGQIVGDLLGDDRVLPIYVMSGLFGGLIYMLHDLLLPGGTGGQALAMGASAAVMAVIWTAAMTSPDYRMNLLLLGPVRLKYIALGLLFMDLVGSAGDINKGGHFAHMGGAAFGMLYVYFLRKGTDLTAPWTRAAAWIDNLKNPKRSIEKTPRSKFKIVHNTAKSDTDPPPSKPYDKQEELDRILDKINSKGYENLTDEEKAFLYNASKNK